MLIHSLFSRLLFILLLLGRLATERLVSFGVGLVPLVYFIDAAQVQVDERALLLLLLVL